MYKGRSVSNNLIKVGLQCIIVNSLWVNSLAVVIQNLIYFFLLTLTSSTTTIVVSLNVYRKLHRAACACACVMKRKKEISCWGVILSTTFVDFANSFRFTLTSSFPLTTDYLFIACSSCIFILGYFKVNLRIHLIKCYILDVNTFIH